MDPFDNQPPPFASHCPGYLLCHHPHHLDEVGVFFACEGFRQAIRSHVQARNVLDLEVSSLHLFHDPFVSIYPKRWLAMASEAMDETG